MGGEGVGAGSPIMTLPGVAKACLQITLNLVWKKKDAATLTIYLAYVQKMRNLSHWSSTSHPSAGLAQTHTQKFARA